MKIACIIIGKSRTNNPNNAILAHCRMMLSYGHDVTAIFDIKDKCLEDLVKLPIRLRAIKKNFFTKIFVANQVENILNELNPDLVIVYNDYSYKILKQDIYPIIYYLGEPISRKITCDGLIYDDVQSYLIYNKNIKVKYENNMCFLPQCSSELVFENITETSNSDVLKISAVGNSKSHQDIISIIRSLGIICSRVGHFLKYKLYIYCDTKSSFELKRLVRIFGMGEYVEFFNLKDHQIKPDIHIITNYSCNDMILFSELCLKNTLIIAPNFGLVSNVISYNNIGVLYKRNDNEALISALEKASLYPNYRKLIANNANKYIVQNSSAKLINDTIFKIKSDK